MSNYSFNKNTNFIYDNETQYILTEPPMGPDHCCSQADPQETREIHFLIPEVKE